MSAEQTKILAEFAHDLANRFHRFYYFGEILQRLISADSAEARDYLEKACTTVEEIESMTSGALSYLRPMELRLVKVQLRDIVGSFRQHVGDRPLEVVGLGETAAVGVAVDPTRLGEALGHACRTVLAQAREGAALDIQVTAQPEVAIVVSVATDQTQPLPFELPLALAAKIFRLHGGDLEIADDRPATLTLRLPVVAQE